MATSGIVVRLLAAGAVMSVFVAIANSAGGMDTDAVTGNGVRGEKLSEGLFCAVCHGPAGNSLTPEWPVLAGQRAEYLGDQLKLFRSRERTNDQMVPLAVTLTDADIVDLAAYFAEAERAPVPGAVSLSESDELVAARLYSEGDVARGIAACASCHGASGQGDVMQRGPALRGQHAIYVAKQLQDYAAGSRYTAKGAEMAGPAAKEMSVLSAKLTAEEMSGLGRLLQRLR